MRTFVPVDVSDHWAAWPAARTPVGAGVEEHGPMELVTLARWQFGITTVYHFLMVPLTIGLGLVVAWFQTRWYRTGDEA